MPPPPLLQLSLSLSRSPSQSRSRSRSRAIFTVLDVGEEQVYRFQSHFRASMINTFDSSWEEEQAFVEDANGRPLGGYFVWPPRCYSCGFCKRQFRSAQALGGHRNIHRRDRARLNQYSLKSPDQSQVLHHQNHSHHPCKSLADILSYPSQERQKELSQYSAPPSCLDSNGVGLLSVSDLKSAYGAGREGFAFKQNGENCPEKSLAMGFDLIDSPNRPYGSDFDHEVINTSSKRHKTSTTTTCSTVSSVPFFLNQYSNDGYSLEDLDLELRLGDPPKVK